jgi:hypothetical protein
MFAAINLPIKNRWKTDSWMKVDERTIVRPNVRDLCEKVEEICIKHIYFQALTFCSAENYSSPLFAKKTEYVWGR